MAFMSPRIIIVDPLTFSLSQYQIVYYSKTLSNIKLNKINENRYLKSIII